MADMSFLPEDYLERRNQRRTNIFTLSLFVVVMSGVIGAFLVTDKQRIEVRAQKLQIDADFAEAAKRLEQLDELQERKKQMMRKAKVTAVLLERVPRSLLLAELINNMPTTLSLTEMELETRALKNNRSHASTAMDRARAKTAAADAPNLPQIQATQVDIELTGVAPTDVQVAQFMTALGQAELFTDVNLVYSEEMTLNDRAMRKFNIEMKLNGEINVHDMEPILVPRALKQNPMANTIHIDADGKLILPPEPASRSDRRDPHCD